MGCNQHRLQAGGQGQAWATVALRCVRGGEGGQIMSLDAARVAPEKAVLRPALPMFLRPGWNGTDMTKLSYSEQLKHPNWQRKRLEILQRADFRCERCQGSESTLHVHHKHYVKGRLAWEYTAAELSALCETCHTDAHDESARFSAVLAGLRASGPFSTAEALALVAGWANSVGLLPAGIQSPLAASPFSFMVGEIAGYMDDLQAATALAVADGLVNLGRAAREAAFADFARQLISLQDHD
jgi:hypothetical protein